MAFYQSVEETMSDLICHMLKRTDHLNIGDQLAAFGQVYREWIKCIKNKDLVPQNILFIKTSTFEKKSIRKTPFFIFRKIPKFLQASYLLSNHLIVMKSTIK